MGSPALGIVTLSRNYRYVKRLSAALANHWSNPPVYRLLVNNHRPGYHADLLRSVARERGWAVWSPGRNTSYSEGNNEGVRRLLQWSERDGAELTHVLLLNDDCVPQPTDEVTSFVGRLWASRERADVLGALLLNSNGTVNHAGVDLRKGDPHVGRGLPLGEVVRRGDEVVHMGGACPPCMAVTGAAMLVKLDLWQRLGGLDEGYVYGFEDTDFCLRALEAGAVIRCERRAVAVHDECGTRPRQGERDVENARRFREQWPPARIHNAVQKLRRRVEPEKVLGDEL